MSFLATSMELNIISCGHFCPFTGLDLVLFQNILSEVRKPSFSDLSPGLDIAGHTGEPLKIV